MIHNYQNFKYSLLESLLLESKLEFSEKISDIFKTIKDDKIVQLISKIQSSKTDLPLVQNYIDISDNKEEVTFISDRRAKQILETGDIEYVTTSDISNRYATINKNEVGEYKNKSIFDALGFSPKSDMDYIVPNPGKSGSILGETISKASGKTFALFKWMDGNKERLIVVNKIALVPNDDRWNKLWSTSRNPIRIGRLMRSVLNVAKAEFTDKDMEDFVNRYKSAYDIGQNALLKFDVVSGKMISYWYDYERYEDQESTLGNSCMKEVPDSYFDIYVYNPKVCSMVILYSRIGEIINGKWHSDKICGRALLWKTVEGDMVMDRIYTNNDSDIDLFKKYAQQNGWWCKKAQSSYNNFTAQKGSEYKTVIYTIQMDDVRFDEYPYFDTFGFVNFKTKLLSNSQAEIDAEGEMEGTSGEMTMYD